MKVRTGFVSNSSSSSFCVIGAYIGGDFYDEAEKLNIDPWVYIESQAGEYRNLGLDVFVGEDELLIGKNVQTDITIDKQIEIVNDFFKENNINEKATFIYGEIYG